MGYKTAIEIAGSELTLEQSITYHLRGNHYPPIPLSMVEPCIKAIQNANTGVWSKMIDLPEGILFRGVTKASVYDIIQAHHLEAWLSTDDDELCEICESNQKENIEGQWCDSCKDLFKESENR